MHRTAPLLLAVALLGCGGSDESVSFQLFGNSEELAVYRQIADAYEKKTGQTVRLVEVADREAHLQRLTTAFAGGNPPDVFLVNYRNFGDLAARGALEPVGPRLEESAAIAREDFYPKPIEAFERNGRLQCLPQNVSSLVVYYNRDALREVGLGDPPRGWSVNLLRSYAQRLHDPPRRHGLGVEPSIVRLAPFVWSAGGDVVDDDRRPSRVTLGSQRARFALRAFLRLAEVGPNEEEAESRSLDERFLDGTLALYMSSRRDVPTFRTIEDFDWDVAPMPRLGRPAGILHSDGYCLARAGRSDAAWRFVEFAAGPEGQRIAAEGGRTVPSLRSVAESRAFLDPSSPPRSSRVFLDAIGSIRRLPNAPGWARTEEAVDLALEDAFYEPAAGEAGEGDALIDELLTRIERETRGFLRP